MSNPNAITTTTKVPTTPGAVWYVVSGQQGVTTGAVALPAHTLVNGVVVKSLADNAATVYVGGAGVTNVTGFPLEPGEAISLAVSNTNLVYVLGTGGDAAAFAGN